MAGRISDWVTDRKWQMSESLALGIVLTLAGGFQDAYSYNCRGKVFANAQTGNIVLMGSHLASREVGDGFPLHGARWRHLPAAYICRTHPAPA